MKKEKKVDELPLIEIISILDRSGSMSSIAKEAIGMYNNFIEEQKKIPGDVKVTTVLFDDQYDILYNGIPLQDVPFLDDNTFVPRGMTALYDAIGKTVQTVSERLKNTKAESKPAKLIIVILTDGAENNSKEFNSAQINKLVDDKLTKNWEFIYLASDLKQFGDRAFKNVNYTMNFAATPDSKIAASIGNLTSKGLSHYMNSSVTGIRNKVYNNTTNEDQKDDTHDDISNG